MTRRPSALAIAQGAGVLAIAGAILFVTGCTAPSLEVKVGGARLDAPKGVFAEVIRPAVSAVAAATGWGWLETILGAVGGVLTAHTGHRVAAKRRAKRTGRQPLP